MSAHGLSASVGEAAESSSGCESGPHLEVQGAARRSVSDLRVLRGSSAPGFGFAGRASHLECPPSEVEYST